MIEQASDNHAESPLSYAERGWPVFLIWWHYGSSCACPKGGACPSPAKHPMTPKDFKDATTDAAQIQAWLKQSPDANWGIATGAVSGLVVLDVDPAKGGAESLRELEATHGKLPDTVQTLTGGGGNHYLLKHPGVVVKNSESKIGPGLDIRGDGGYIVAPPSLHASGRRYEFEASSHPDDVELAEIPGWLLEMVAERPETRAPAPPVEGRIPDGERNKTLTSLAGSMRRRSMSEAAIEAALLTENAEKCDPPLSDSEVHAIAASVAQYPPVAQYHQPIIVENKWPSPLAEEAYYGITGDVVNAIAPHTEADPAAILFNFLCYIGNAIGRSPHAMAEAAKHGTNINIVIVGETSRGRKGSSENQVREPIHRVDPAWAETRILGRLSSGEGLIWAVRDPIEKTEPVKEKGKPTGDYQTYISDEGVTDKRLVAYEPEFASMLKIMSRESNTLSAIIRQAWDRGSFRILTKNSPATSTDAHISILGHITKAELLRYLHDTEMGNGFANRFLWVCAKRAQILPEGGGVPNYQHIVPKLHDSIEKAKTLGKLTRDYDTRKAWASVYAQLSEGAPGLLGAVTARSEAQVPHLSVIYAALDGSETIRMPHLMAALAVWQYAEESARYIFGDATGDPVADRIYESLVQFGEMSRTDINSKVFGRHVSAGRISQALALLLKSKKARFERRETDGRSLEVWMAM